MYNFSLLSEEEYKKICSVIPHKMIVHYFQKNPKEFNKLLSGHRAISISNAKAIELLINYRKRGFISSFVERIVSDWLKEIQSVVQKYQTTGESEITSYIHTLYQSFFADNVSAYFKLIDKTYSEEQLDMISNLVAMLKGIDEKQHELEFSSNGLKEELTNSIRKAEKSDRLLEKANRKLAELTAKLNELDSIQKQYQKLNTEHERTKRDQESAMLQISELTQQISILNEMVKRLQNEKEELETTIRAKVIEEQEAEALKEEISFPLAPEDMDEFVEYFAYNLESIGVVNSDLPINNLLTTYISSILFRGKPIICSKSCASTFAKCLSNTLINNAPISCISFSPELDEKQIQAAINRSGRIVVLENFLGNYNETVLLSILDRHKSKIIILSVTYEKTLYYLPKDFLSYSYYINLSHVSGFANAMIPDEDPSCFVEKEIKQPDLPSNNRFRDVIRSIAAELGFSTLLSEKVSEFVRDEKSACAVLTFSILPYVRDVFGKNPFNISESLQRYVNRCAYKKVFEEWFMA